MPRILASIVEDALGQFPVVVLTGQDQSRNGLLPIDVKMTSRAQLGDIRSLEAFLDEYSKDARFGVLLYGGETIVPLTPRIVAVPVRAIL
jgi:hypothetical protein